MSELRNRPIRKFNPGTLQTDDEVIEQFVVRKHELDIVLDVLRGNVESSSCQHVLVVAPRGRGKTMLLARVAAELRADDVLSQHLLPVRFMEESQEIFNLTDFWLETLFHLARESAAHDPEFARALRETHEDLTGRWREQLLEGHARATVLDAADRLGKKLVLMVENLQALCENVDDDFGWQLRKVLQVEPQIILLATATSRFEGLDDVTQPFFELFRIVDLQRLSTEECRRLWQVVSGDEVSGREIRPLEILTGGNPRLLVIIAGFSQHRSLCQLMEELVKLIDEHTEYFRSQLEVLAKTERRVYVAVIDLWRASSTGEIARRARMDVRTVSTLLGRLVNRGVVLVEGSGKKRLYDAERLYSIYYKLRRERNETAVVENLIRFMVTFYSEAELAEMSGTLKAEAAQSKAIREGIEQARAELPQIDSFFSSMAWLGLEGPSNHAATIDEEVVKGFGASDARALQARMAKALVNKVVTQRQLGDFAAAIGACDEIIERFGGSDVQEFQVAVAKALVDKSVAQGQLGDFAAAIAVCDEIIGRFGESDVLELQVEVAKTLVNKSVAQGQLGDFAAAIAACDEGIKRFSGSDIPALQVVVARTLVDKSVAQRRLGDFAAAIAVCDEIIERFDESDVPELQVAVARALVNKGFAKERLGDFVAVIAVCDEVIKRFGGSNVLVATMLINKGVAQRHLGDFAAAIAAYDEGIKRFGGNNVPELQVAVATMLINKGVVQRHLGDFAAAIAAYDEIIERFGGSDVLDLHVAVARALINKGVAQRQLGDFAAAISAYDEGIKRFGGNNVPELQVTVATMLINKGVAQEQLGDLKAAIVADDEIIERFGGSDVLDLHVAVARALINKGVAQGQLGDFAAAIVANDEVIKRFGGNNVPELQLAVAKALVNKGVEQKQLGDFAAAIAANDEGIKRFGESDVPGLQVAVATMLINKGFIQGQVGDLAEVIVACDEGIKRFGGNNVPELQVAVATMLINKGVAQGQLGDFVAAIAACDEGIKRFGGSDVLELQVAVATMLINKGVAQGQLGDFVAVIAACDEGIKRFGGSDVPELQVAVATALHYKSIGQIDIGRAEEALHTCEELEQQLGTLAGVASLVFEWRAMWVRTKALVVQEKHHAAMDTFRSTYTLFVPGNETMLLEMLRLVPDLIAVGASEHDLVEILSSDRAKSDALLPLVVALRERIGEKVRAPAEVLEVAADIREHIKTITAMENP